MCELWQSFLKQQVLKYHKRVSHKNSEVKIICVDDCGAQFSSETNMLRHQSLTHTVNLDETKNECDACGKTFSRKDHLYRHKREQHYQLTKENLSYVGDLRTLNVNKCEQCDKLFKRPSDLKRHLQMVHGVGGANQEQLHQCNKCEKTFGWKSSLERHIKTKHPDT